ncbi:MAG: sortase [Patescibacteria group bacterium]|nr:sortase [Patescibacteria group bacterium]
MHKKLAKYFLLLAAVLLAVFNWGYISWLFNYQFLGDNLSYLAGKLVRRFDLSVSWDQLMAQASSSGLSIIQASPQAGIQTVSGTAPQPQQPAQLARDFAKQNYQAGNDFISIPKIGARSPILITSQNSNSVFLNLLKKGVLLYPLSVLPGKRGVTVILGHSAPPKWPGQVDRIFNRLKDLEAGDSVLVHFNGKDYNYEVKRTYFVDRGGELSALTFDKNVLLLVSCWPPGKNIKRIVVEAEINNN